MGNELQPKTYADVLFEAKRGFVIIGLTGYTGSGCTTTARILSKADRFSLPDNFGDELKKCGDTYAVRQFKKLKDAWDGMNWIPYTEIEVGAVILGIVLKNILADRALTGVPDEIIGVANQRESDLNGLDVLSMSSPISVEDCRRLVCSYQVCVEIQKDIKKGEVLPIAKYIEFMQKSGDNIRLFGGIAGGVPDPKNMLIIPEAIRKVISAYKKAERRSRFVIDAFRNPFEVEYFKRRYAEFYLLCVMRDQEERAASLRRRMAEPDIERIWEKEKGVMPTGGMTKENCLKTRENIGWWVTWQNIPECAQKADVYIKLRKKSHAHLHYHLARLLSLIHKPGLLTPTQDEYHMQIAATSRHMSGCLSRQVGATAVGKDGYMLGAGWNDPPEGQVPCSLRSCEELLIQSRRMSVPIVYLSRARNLRTT